MRSQTNLGVKGRSMVEASSAKKLSVWPEESTFARGGSSFLEHLLFECFSWSLFLILSVVESGLLVLVLLLLPLLHGLLLLLELLLLLDLFLLLILRFSKITLTKISVMADGGRDRGQLIVLNQLVVRSLLVRDLLHTPLTWRQKI